MRADLWQRGCERLASELPDQQFNTWIRPLPDADVADNGEGAVVTCACPNRFKLDWIRNQYAGRIETVLSELAGKPVRLDVTLAQRDGARAPARRRGRAGAPGRRRRRAARRGARRRRRTATPAPGQRQRTRGAGAERRRPCRRGGAALAQPAQSGADLRHARSRPRQPDGAHRRAARRRLARPHVQPALHLRRRRPRQDAPDPRRRQRAPRRPARRAHPLPARRAVHHRRGEELPEEDLRRAEGEVPLARPAADRRRPVLRRQGAHAGGVLQRLRGAARQARAHHHDERHLSEGTGRHRRAADVALRCRAHRRDRAARARDAGRDPDEEGRPGSDADARGRRLLRRQERSRQRARARRARSARSSPTRASATRTSTSSSRARR